MAEGQPAGRPGREPLVVPDVFLVILDKPGQPAGSPGPEPLGDIIARVGAELVAERSREERRRRRPCPWRRGKREDHHGEDAALGRRL